ncbi:MAG: hypothetical protein EZS28_005617 [Streblomastix strix]|uniref:Uncharacterized protein n=1 Tax=Streblomastix strix TaxID=222440 RepID=A0A5J4WWD9_9EUKA|nr:MAG: hypothetical protein EZS28_005617 [Streblomastix strix]
MNIADVQDIADKVTFWSQMRYVTNGSAEFGQKALKFKNCPTSDASCERNFSESRQKLCLLEGNLETIKFLRELEILETAKQKLEQKKLNGQAHNRIGITSESVLQPAKGQEAKLKYSTLPEKVENSKQAENPSPKQSASERTTY